jgi:hypothetical protein
MRLITNPRPSNTAINTSTVNIKSQPITHQINDEAKMITHQTDAQFLEGKFVCYAPTHHSAVVMGSTIQDEKSNRVVLDACKIVYRENKDHIRTSIDMALADGDNTSQDRRNHYYISDTCDHLVDTDSYDAPELPDNTILMSHKALGTVSRYNADQKAKSTLIAAKLTSKSSDHVKASCIKVGDGVLLVIDSKTGCVKHIINPRKFELENGKKVPIFLQSLLHKQNPLLYVDRKEFHLEPNDLVIFGSAGFVDTLEGIEKTYSIETQETEDEGSFTKKSGVTFTRKEIDKDKLNARLKIIFENLRPQYPIQPPAFAIAEALIKDTAQIILVERQEEQRFTQLMRIWIREYKRSNCSEELMQYNDNIKSIREQCTMHCVNDNYSNLKEKIQNFRSALFKAVETPNEYYLNHPNCEQFDNLIIQKLMQSTNQDDSGKGKAHLRESIEKSELTHDQLCQFIIDTLRFILQKEFNLEKYVNEMMDLIVTIFREEINNFADKLSEKSISAERIARYSQIFRNQLKDIHLDPSTTESLEKFLKGFRDIWSHDLDKWINDDHSTGGKLSDRLIKLIKNYQNIDDEAIIKSHYLLLLRYVQHLDDTHKAQIRALPLPGNTITQFVNWCDSNVPSNREFLPKLQLYLKDKIIDPNQPLHELEPHFSLQNKVFGDDTTVAVACVLDPALEITRALVKYCTTDIYYWSLESHCKVSREEYWIKLCNLYPDRKPGAEALACLVAKLRAEQQVGRLGKMDYYNSYIGSQKLEDLKSHIVHSYTEDEILSLEHFFSLKTKLQVEVTGINNVTASVADKSAAHNKLNAILLNPQLGALEICGLYNELTKTQFDKLNKHRHSLVDYWLGITVTKSWSLTLKTIRDNCLTKLIREVDGLLNNNGAAPTNDQCIKALALLNNAVVQPLFNTHRNNSIFTGAYGDTEAAKIIRQRITIITDQLTVLQNTQVDGVELKPLQPMKQ